MLASVPGKRALILTVGAEQGGDGGLAEALTQSLKRKACDFLVLVASPQSKDIAQHLAERLQWPAESLRIDVVDNAHDLDGVFRTVNASINRLIAWGYSLDHITVNYTGGTKVMCSGAVLSAIFNSCEGLEYMTGMGGDAPTRQTLSTRPRAIFAYRDLTRARSHLLATQFRSAAEALTSIDESLLTDHDRRLTQNLRLLEKAYAAWEANRVADFLEIYARVEFGAKELAPFQLRPEQAESLRGLAEDCRAERRSALLCVEMRNSALRFHLEGHYDDAVQRLYRALEILAQWALETRHAILTDDVDTRKVPPRDRARFEGLRSLDDGKVKVGMQKAYELLALRGEPIGVDFQDDSNLQASVQDRERSMLAHGAAPITHEICRRFLGAATAFFGRHVEAFPELCRALQFPWLGEEGLREPENAAKGN